MIAFVCSECGKLLKIKEEAAGRKGRCPHCQQPMTVPTATEATRARMEPSSESDSSIPPSPKPKLRGESLEERFQRERQLPIAELLRIGKETAEELADVHERGAIHRDLKPANIWLEGDKGRVKILDAGAGRSARAG